MGNVMEWKKLEKWGFPRKNIHQKYARCRFPANRSPHVPTFLQCPRPPSFVRHGVRRPIAPEAGFFGFALYGASLDILDFFLQNIPGSPLRHPREP